MNCVWWKRVCIFDLRCLNLYKFTKYNVNRETCVSLSRCHLFSYYLPETRYWKRNGGQTYAWSMVMWTINFCLYGYKAISIIIEIIVYTVQTAKVFCFYYVIVDSRMCFNIACLCYFIHPKCVEYPTIYSLANYRNHLLCVCCVLAVSKIIVNKLFEWKSKWAAPWQKKNNRVRLPFRKR
jgi:hypothetical protein